MFGDLEIFPIQGSRNTCSFGVLAIFLSMTVEMCAKVGGLAVLFSGSYTDVYYKILSHLTLGALELPLIRQDP